MEGALKLAKRFTRRTQIVTCRNAYHGHSHGALSVAGSETWKADFRPLLPDVHAIDFGAIDQLEEITDRTACFIAETVQGEAGYIVPDPGWLRAARAACDRTGALLILDEIQAGCGRTGRLWAFEHAGVVPDIVLLAKAFGGGMPLGAFVAAREVMQCLTHDPVLGHITTFGGHPVSCAAALAALEAMTSERLWERVPAIEARFREGLQHSDILGVEGIGLMLAVRFASAERNHAVIDRCVEGGLLTDWFLYAEDRMRIAPPLTISDAEVDHACDVIRRAVEATA